MSIIGHEIKLMWKEFRFSAKRSLTLILIIELIIGVVAVSTVLGLAMYLLFVAQPQLGGILIRSLIQLGLTSTVISDIIYFVSLLFLVSSFIRGLVSSSFGLVFSRVDENIIVSSPVALRSLYIAKKFKGLIMHVLTVITILLAVFPLITEFGFQGFRLTLLFITLLALMEIYGFTENISYCVSRALRNRKSHSRAWALVTLVILMAFVLSSPFIMVLGGSASDLLAYFYPPYVFSRIVMLSSSLDIVLGVCALSGEAIFFFLVASVTAKSGLRTWVSSPRLVQTRSSLMRIRKNKVVWRTGKKAGIRLMFAKDFWVTLRNPSKFFVPFGIALALLFFAFVFQTMLVLPAQPTGIQLSEGVFLLSTYLVTICILSPAWDSFAGERRTFFILKNSPINPANIVRGKYLLALLQSAIFIAPIIGAMFFVLPHTLDVLLVALEVALVLLVSNSVGILVSASYPPAYRGMGPPPFLILLGLPLLCATLTVIIPISLTLSYGNVALFQFTLACVLAYVYVVSGLCLKKATQSFTKLQEF
nr:hypothetical protein [Candidatus Njordarchaeum guaymaensis]